MECLVAVILSARQEGLPSNQVDHLELEVLPTNQACLDKPVPPRLTQELHLVAVATLLTRQVEACLVRVLQANQLLVLPAYLTQGLHLVAVATLLTRQVEACLVSVLQANQLLEMFSGLYHQHNQLGFSVLNPNPRKIAVVSLKVQTCPLIHWWDYSSARSVCNSSVTCGLVLSRHPLWSGQFSKARKLLPLYTVKLTSVHMKWKTSQAHLKSLDEEGISFDRCPIISLKKKNKKQILSFFFVEGLEGLSQALKMPHFPYWCHSST